VYFAELPSHSSPVVSIDNLSQTLPNYYEYEPFFLPHPHTVIQDYTTTVGHPPYLITRTLSINPDNINVMPFGTYVTPCMRQFFGEGVRYIYLLVVKLSPFFIFSHILSYYLFYFFQKKYIKSSTFCITSFIFYYYSNKKIIINKIFLLLNTIFFFFFHINHYFF
jgi:hypothetical protein